MTRACSFSLWRTAALAAVAAILVVACGSVSTRASTANGGTVTFAEAPASPPNYISPMEGGPYGNNDRYQFSNLLYLPLYTFGEPKNQLALNTGLSIAKPPVFSDNNKVVTITLKHWMWSNGQPVTARDVIFWMNLVSAATDPQAPSVGSTSAPGPGWAYSAPGAFPQNIASYQATGTDTVVLDLNASYNPTWYLEEELTQIFPMPQKTWDKLSTSGPVGNYDASAEARIVAPASAGLPADSYVPANPGTGTTGALGVAQFVNVQSEDLSTYETNPLWRVVDGPFKLSRFTTSGYVKLVPNKAYSGSPKPTISAFEEEPFTSDTAEFDSLETGGLTIGYIPSQDLAEKASLEKTQGYSFSPWNVSTINVLPYDFTDSTVGPLFNQLYFRQTLQSLVNQPEYIKDFGGGVGVVDNGVVPINPAHNPYVSPLEAKGLVYPYSPAKAVSLLKDHGWTVNPRGISVCARAGSASDECGAGVKAGQPATFSLEYVSGSTQLTDEMEAMQSTMKSKAGVTVNLDQATFAQVISIASGCYAATPCSWDMVEWGTTGSWTYDVPLPAGAQVFNEEGANSGDWVNSTNASNILATETAPTYSAEIKALFKYENYVAREVPFLLFPVGPAQLTMYKSKLKGLQPQGFFDEIFPEYYSLKH